MTTRIALVPLILCLGPLTAAECAAGDPRPLSVRYVPHKEPKSFQAFEARIDPVSGKACVYGTIHMGPANPIRYVGGIPEWRPESSEKGEPEANDHSPSDNVVEVPGGFVMKDEHPPVPRREGRPRMLQTIILGRQGTTADAKAKPILRFGLADDGRAEHFQEKAMVTPWVSDGHIDYYGPHARPNTPYDFKLLVDLNRKRMTAWISGRGDDAWFLLAEDVTLTLPEDLAQIDHVRVELYRDGPAVENLIVASQPYGPGEEIRPHPAAKADRVIGPGKGFQFQSLRSTWGKPRKHVTIFRQPGVHAGFPDVAQAGPKHLVCAWRNGSHTGGTGGLSIAHSYDLGKTWGEPTVVSRLHVNCPRLHHLKDGTLLLIADKSSGGSQFTTTWDLILWDSTDGGKTWTNERWLRARQVGGGGCIVPSRICEMADGSWLLAASYFAPPPGGGQWVENLDYYRTADRGHTWQFVSQPGHYPPFSLSEPSPIQLSDGRLLVYARESRADGMPGAKGYSTDGAKTWSYHELPHPITGRTCAALLRDGRVMNTFRSGVGRAALRAWIGDPNDMTASQPAGGHFNDRQSVGLKDGALHIDNDGMCGQFTKYTLRPPDAADSIVDLTFEVKVLANQGRAATVSIPFAGKLRVFPDHVVMAHDPALRVDVAAGQFHTYQVTSRVGQMKLFVDGKLRLDTNKADSRLQQLPWTRISTYSLEFGNEAKGIGAGGQDVAKTMPDVYPANITPEVTGYSVWPSFEAVLEDPRTGKRKLSWVAARDGFPDQYQLDHMIEIEASASGHDQGYSGWIQLDDGRIFVVHYTDDTSAASRPNPHNFGVPWIRGTFLELSDLPPRK